MDGDVFAIHERLKQELQYYIRSQYFGKSPLLLAAFEEEFMKKGVLYQTPYLESPAVYKRAEDGLSGLSAPVWLKAFFSQLAEKDLGVYPTPYEHQIASFALVNKNWTRKCKNGQTKSKYERHQPKLVQAIIFVGIKPPSMIWSQLLSILLRREVAKSI